jgi:hypothetical protein
MTVTYMLNAAKKNPNNTTKNNSFLYVIKIDLSNLRPSL